MVGTQIFKTILFPTDFSEESLKALRYVVDLSIACNADLIVLHTFRLISNGDDHKNMLEAKKEIEENAQKEFKSIEDNYLINSNIRYIYLSEIGFASDRIISNIRAYNVDLLVLSDKAQSRIKERFEKGYKGIMEKVACPIMLMPVTITDHNHLAS